MRTLLTTILLASLLQANACVRDPVINEWADYYAIGFGLDPMLVHAVIAQESSYCIDALGIQTEWGKAMGLMQLLPGTAADCGIDAWNPVENIWCGTRLLRQNYDRFGDWNLAIAAYFAGAENIAAYNGIPPGFPKTAKYVEEVLGRYDALARRYYANELP